MFADNLGYERLLMPDMSPGRLSGTGYGREFGTGGFSEQCADNRMAVPVFYIPRKDGVHEG